MNPVILKLIAPAAAPSPEATASGGARAALASNAFSALLAGKLNVALAARVPAGPAADPALAALEAKIAKMTKAGMSNADIVETLAAQLAAAVARELGTTSADARAQLEAVMREALAPPGDNSVERSAADRTQTLAQRFLQLQAIAASIVDGRKPGQQNDIAGTFLDATTAKEHPAPASATQQNSGLQIQLAVAASARTATPSLAAGAPARAHVLARGASVRPRTVGLGHGHIGKLGPVAMPNGDAATLGRAVAATAALTADARLPLALRPATGGAQAAPRDGPQPASRNTTQAATAGAAQTATGSALQAPTSDASAAAAAQAAPGAGALSQSDAAGDGRTVKLVDRIAVATRGDTVLGRVLTRAALAADARQTQVGARQAKMLASPTPSDRVAVGSKGASVSASATLPAGGRAKTVQAAVAITARPQSDVSAATRNLEVGAAAGTAAGDGKQAAGDVVATSDADRPARNPLPGGDPTPGGGTTIVANLPATGESPVTGRLLSNAPDGALPARAAGAATSTSKALGLGAAVATDAAAAVVGGMAVADTGLGNATANRLPMPAPIGGNGNPAGTVSASQPAVTGKPPDPAVAAFVKSFAAAVRALGSVARVEAAADTAPSPSSPPLGSPDASGAAFLPAAAPFTIQQMAPATAPASPPHQPPIDQSSIVDQVLRGAFLHNTGASSEMRLSLVPESLGDVNIKLIVTAGTVSAHVVAQTPEVRDALVAAQPQLTKSLAEAGLKLESYTVDLSGNGFAGFSRQQQDGSQHGNRAPRATGLRDDDSDDAGLDAVPSFGPSIASAARTGDYNYLA